MDRKRSAAAPAPVTLGTGGLAELETFAQLVDSVRDYAIFLLDETGHVRSWNAGAQAIKGWTREEILGRHFSTFYTAADLERHWPARELEIANSQGRFEDAGWRIRKDGTPFWAGVVITALRDAEGQPRGFLKITRDLTERRREEERLRLSEERFRLLVTQVRDYAIFMLDPDGRINTWNEGAERTYGWRADEAVGRHFSLFYPPEVAASGWPDEELQLAVAQSRFENEGWRLRKDGTRFWANVVITPLHHTSGELRGFAKVVRDMTVRKRVERLEEEGRRTSEFLAMLGHELRNPLAPIRNAIAILRSPGSAPDAEEWSRDVIERQVRHLTRLVDDLLDVSRITRGLIRLNRERLDFTALVRRTVESVSHAVADRGHTLELRLPDEALYVDGDATRLAQVVVNLLTNAIKYTPAGGRLDVMVERVMGYAVLRVRDTGVGIPAELLPRIFDLFIQGERSIDRTEGGLGIGLTLVNRLVELHGGSVQAVSAGPGRGSEFIARLPALVTGAHHPAADAAPARPQAPPRRVLVVDDNIDSAESMALLLQGAGHQVVLAHDGPAALETVLSTRPEVVFLDIGLPMMNGYEVARRIRGMSSQADTALVAMTGYGTDEDRLRSLQSGFHAHLVKPVDPVMFDRILMDPARVAREGISTAL